METERNICLEESHVARNIQHGNGVHQNMLVGIKMSNTMNVVSTLLVNYENGVTVRMCSKRRCMRLCGVIRATMVMESEQAVPHLP
jgi:hypothetical protein